jgi:HSP20 family molecular chaperone IbpA|tara:strand:- start:321 stop:737 length:417 start_codon:yes stop_codon:yes gene_type:complete
MGNQLTLHGTSPFDILFRDFFKSDAQYTPYDQIKVNHPVDIYEANEGLNIDIACVGLTKEDINLTIESDVLRVEYNKQRDSEQPEYIQRNIAKRAFNFGWRISPRFNLGQLQANLENGLLHLHAPLAEESKVRHITIK